MALTLFMYHRVLPEKCPGALTVAEFERSLDYLRKHYRMLPAAEVEPYVTGELRERGDLAALSFDDAWADNLFHASPVLKRRGLSALLAVSAGCLHDGEERESLPREILYRSMDAAQAAARAGDCAAYLNRAELAAMQESGVWRLEVHGTRHELGSAGASLLSCPQNGMGEAEFREFLAADLDHARAEVEKLTGRRHRMLFWPWGHYSAAAVETARACGFDIQFTVEKGYIRNGDSRAVLPRVGVPPRYKKFVRNSFVFRHPLLAFLHGFSHRLKMDFSDIAEAAK